MADRWRSQPVTRTKLSNYEKWAIALAAPCAVSSLDKILDGRPVRGRVAARIINALAEAGLLGFVVPAVKDENLRERMIAMLASGQDPKPLLQDALLDTFERRAQL